MNKKQQKILESNVEEMLKLINSESGDTEVKHIRADEILLNCFKELGFTQIVEAYEQVENSCRSGFWYA